MKKLIASLAFFASCAAFADSYLYWMVGSTGSYSYDTVRVAAKSGDEVTYLNLYYGDGCTAGDSISSGDAVDYQNAGLGLYAQLLSSDTATYAIELFNDDTYVAQSGATWVNANSLSSYIVSSPMSAPVAAWAPSYGVPEPSSGLMMLLGTALLALKRKRQKA